MAETTNKKLVKLLVKRGPENMLPSLDEGELAFTTDTNKYFVGSTKGNIELGSKADIEELTGQLAETAGLFSDTETPVYKNGALDKVLKSSGSPTVFSYNQDGTLKQVTEEILGKTVITVLNYEGGQFVSTTKTVGEEIPTVYPSTLIASIDNMLVNKADDNLYLSIDGGRSYTKSLSVSDIDIIKYIHLFRNGELLIADNQKVYYSHDWTSLRESKVFDIDGNTFIPSNFDSFSLFKGVTNRSIIEGEEILCWGNYAQGFGTDYGNINAWYTADKGKTVKSCYRFNRTDSLSARHIHNVDFNPSDNSFWLQTGDEPLDGVEMSHVLKGNYDVENDSWVWEIVGSGLPFKWSTVAFYENRVYFAHDIPGGGVKTCLYTEISDSSKHSKIMSTNNDTIGLFIGERGDMIVTQTKWGGDMSPRIFYYSEDRITFHQINGTVPAEMEPYENAIFYATMPPNKNGKILTGVWSSDKMPLSEWDRTPSVFLDDMIHEAGFPNAFKPL